MGLYRVLQPLTHDGKPYKPDSTVTIPEDAAAELLELKAITPLSSANAPLGTSPESTPPAEDPMIVTQQVMTTVEAVDPTLPSPEEEAIDPKKAPPSMARKQQQKSE